VARDYYELLGVARNASEEELKRAYRNKARELHPDANGGDAAAEARFKEVSVAYETLRDPERRRRYDMFGESGAGRGQNPGDIFGGGGLGDLFESFFGQSTFGQQRQSGPRRGEDVELVLDVRFEEAVFGASREVLFRGLSVCGECGGSGASPGTQPVTCVDCHGQGQVQRVRQSILGQVVTSGICPSCRGMGQTVPSPCVACRGEGRRTEDKRVEVGIPPGVDDATTLKVSGGGGAALRGGLAGDLYVHLRVAAHERFERAGADLVAAFHVPLTQAALGGELEFETLDGTEHITIPAGTQTGRIIRLKGRGVPHVRGRGRGDLHVRLVVDTPADLSREQEALLRELAAMRGERVSEETGLFGRLRSSRS
jgi:molecular chaperone DnaJ